MKEAVLAFIRAVLWGSIAGGGPFMVLTLPIAITGTDWSQPDPMAIWVAFIPMIIAGGIVASAAVCIGLPLTAWLAFAEAERQHTYVWAGLGLGALLPLAVALLLDGGSVIAYLALPGALAGAATARVWGGWREKVTRRPAEPWNH